MLSKNNSISSVLNLALNHSSVDRAILVGADRMLSVDDEFCRAVRHNEREEDEGGSGNGHGHLQPHEQQTGQASDEPLTTIEQEDAKYLVDVLGLNQMRDGHHDNPNNVQSLA
jgi:hypothetical protein